MEKRSAARELAFLALFQLPRKTENIDIEKLARTDLDAICLSAIRTLADHAKDNIKVAESFFIKTERSLMEYQINHELNEPLTEATRGVPLPRTDEFIQHLNNCYQGLALMKECLQVPEVYWHHHDHATRDFTIDLLLNFVKHKEEVQNLITEVSKIWRFERMTKIDRTLLELGVTELISCDVAHAVVVSELIKLANKYSNEEAVKFINGILADVIKELSRV